MPGLRYAGALWMTAGVVCAGLLIVVFVGENLLLRNPVLSADLAAGAIAALLTGRLLIARPAPAVVRWSMVLGLAWLAVFGSLTISALGGSETGPMVSSGLMTVLGVAGALVSFLAWRFGPPSRAS
jgi:hypothetical protein